MPPRGFPTNAVHVRTTWRGPNPITVFEVASIDQVYGLGMSGHTGHLRYGAGAFEARARGYLAPVQDFIRSGTVGASTNLRGAGHKALPSTSQPPARANRVLDLFARAEGPRP